MLATIVIDLHAIELLETIKVVEQVHGKISLHAQQEKECRGKAPGSRKLRQPLVTLYHILIGLVAMHASGRHCVDVGDPS